MARTLGGWRAVLAPLIKKLAKPDQVLARPASEKEIAAYEKVLKKKLPPSYRAMLSLHGGWESFLGTTNMLGPADHGDKHVRSRILDFDELFREFEVVNPLDDAIVLAVCDGRPLILLEPPVKGDGEMDVVEYDIVEERARHTDIAALMIAKLTGKHGAPREKPTLGRNAKESALLALDGGNVDAFLAAFASAKKPGPTLEFVGVRVDNSRVSARYGQVLLGASDFLLAQKREHIRRFLPCMAIACARQLQHKIGANRARAADVAKRLRPLLAEEPFEAELAGAWAGGLLEDKKWKEALDLYDIVLACKTMQRRSAYVKARAECARHVKKP